MTANGLSMSLGHPELLWDALGGNKVVSIEVMLMDALHGPWEQSTVLAGAHQEGSFLLLPQLTAKCHCHSRLLFLTDHLQRSQGQEWSEPHLLHPKHIQTFYAHIPTCSPTISTQAPKMRACHAHHIPSHHFPKRGAKD